MPGSSTSDQSLPLSLPPSPPPPPLPPSSFPPSFLTPSLPPSLDLSVCCTDVRKCLLPISCWLETLLLYPFGLFFQHSTLFSPALPPSRPPGVRWEAVTIQGAMRSRSSRTAF